MSAYRVVGWPPTSSHPNRDHRVQLSEGTFVELVRSAFMTLLPATIMTLSFIGVGFVIIHGTLDRSLLVLFVLSVVAALICITVVVLFRKIAAHEGLSAKMAGTLERRFALAYLGFACMFGAFTARAFALAPAENHMLIVGLLFGYGAGVAGISLRPWISIPSALIAIMPMIIVSLFMAGPKFWLMGALTAAFLAGGIGSMLKHYQATSKQFAMNRLVSTLARRDSLTGLPNRLLLGERFAELRSALTQGELVALHRLDLDQFRSINETYGHSTGDALLKAVVKCLNDILESGDFAVRLGGVEFAVVQTGLVQARQAELFARRVIATIAKSYSIGGHDIEIRVNIGYVHGTQRRAELDHMLASANQALNRAKNKGTEVACYNRSRWTRAEEAA